MILFERGIALQFAQSIKERHHPYLTVDSRTNYMIDREIKRRDREVKKAETVMKIHRQVFKQ